VLTLRFIKLSIKAALEYRTDFIFMIAVGIIWQVTVVAFATVVITRFPGLGGWSAGDVLLVASVRLAGHTFASGFFIGLRQVSELTAEGKIDAFLLRPLPVYRQVMLNYFHMPEFGGLAVVAVMFAAAVRMVDLDWTPVAHRLSGGLGGRRHPAGGGSANRPGSLRAAPSHRQTVAGVDRGADGRLRQLPAAHPAQPGLGRVRLRTPDRVLRVLPGRRPHWTDIVATGARLGRRRVSPHQRDVVFGRSWVVAH
jgi:hypothetical protein